MSAVPWTSASPGVLALPGGAFVRGRPLRNDLGPADLTLVLGRGAPPAWTYRRLRWPDFGLPLDRDDALDALAEAYALARRGRRVEVACWGGVGRTGTALAALAVLDGLAPDDAVAWVRCAHHPRAVETPWQRRWLRHVAALPTSTRRC
ncbi:protein-tyrosine phosphatase family protein [Microlunatus flavus]|uniref:Protein-tyrosine phosphatase n=1 Tax=Microlunatus flavus TaxID=1036181 RepID=A0A1H9MM27_9ACTN|nr:protein-tyrosine phosphatase family protein [Microlunatus flavus]SER24213.1 Protein-tyrosine phosphatase [Microlunatus flavus]